VNKENAKNEWTDCAVKRPEPGWVWVSAPGRDGVFMVEAGPNGYNLFRTPGVKWKPIEFPEPPARPQNKLRAMKTEKGQRANQNAWHAADNLPPVNKLGDSGFLLCMESCSSNPFVGWYNHVTHCWMVAHYSAPSSARPVTFWRELPKGPAGEAINQ